MLILIGIPVPERIDPLFALDSLPRMLDYAKKRIPGLEFHIKAQTGVRTDRNRNSILYKAINEGIKFDYVLWLDCDMTYPEDIIYKFLQDPKDLMGCMYYNRGVPYNPNVFLSGDNKIRPYKPVDPRKLPEDQWFEVDGLGYGGMMVSAKVYETLGDKKWTHYGHNFYFPMEMEDQLSHDLQFCKDSKEAGFKIFVHTGIEAKHIGMLLIGREEWENNLKEEEKKKEPVITLIMPSIDMPKANATALQLMQTAGMSFNLLVVEDVDRKGFIAIVNETVRKNPSDFYIYTAQDAFGGKDWLKIAYETMEKENAGLFAFNDGKWNGELAAFGMVRHEWMEKNYLGDLFCNLYKSHYADTELTMLALKDGKLSKNPESLMIEVDYDKKSHGVNLDDKELYAERVIGMKLPRKYG